MPSLHAPDVSAAVRADVKSGRFSVARANYTDPEIFRAEMERVFSRCWLYVGHDTEVIEPNRFVTRSVGGRAVIFLRDRNGQVRCFLNICPHREAQI